MLSPGLRNLNPQNLISMLVLRPKWLKVTLFMCSTYLVSLCCAVSLSETKRIVIVFVGDARMMKNQK